MVMVTRPLPRVLLLHTGGTLGMDTASSFEISPDGSSMTLRQGTGGSYTHSGGLRPGTMLASLLSVVPELTTLANLDLKVVFNKDSCRVGPPEWIALARALDRHRREYDAFVVVHGTDTLAFTASALSLMLAGFKRPIVVCCVFLCVLSGCSCVSARAHCVFGLLVSQNTYTHKKNQQITGSQLPLSSPRSDARQNLIDALTCATAAFSPPHIALSEVAVCFGGRLMRGNRCQKINSSSYQAFDSPGYPHLATLGIDVAWNERALLRGEGAYRPR